jgi:hypothetical protein
MKRLLEQAASTERVVRGPQEWLFFTPNTSKTMSG